MNILITVLCCLAAVVIVSACLLICFPYEVFKFIIMILRHTCFVERFDGEEYVPKSGPALFVANHVSIFDSFIMMAITKRKIHFMMHTEFYHMKFFGPLFRRMGVIEVPRPGPKKMLEFMEKTRQLLRDGELICMFPEGGVSGNGLILRFKKGLSRMLPPDRDVPILPVRIGMLWGSMFPYYKGHFHFIMPRQFPIPVAVAIGKRISPNITPFQLRQLISEMGADVESEGFPSERTIHYAFARQVRRHPFHCMYKDAEKQGPKDLDTLIKALIFSRVIRRLDEKNDSKYIGVLLPNCVNAAIVLYGVLFADRIPAILNYSVGEAVRRASIEKAGIKLILTSRKFLEKLKLEPTPEMFLLEDIRPYITKSIKYSAILDAILLPSRLLMCQYAPKTWRDSRNDAVLLFSSGSTGMPKGIMLTHHNLNSNFFNFWRTVNWTPHDTTVGNLPLFHAFGFMIGFVLPSLCGTRVTFLLNPLDAQGVCNAVEKDKLTLLIATPTFLQTYMRKLKPGQFNSLRFIITGAEKLRNDISEKVKAMTGLTVTEGFGCTELSPIVAINLAPSVFTLGRECGKPGSIGAPLPGIHVKIVDPETFEELPENTPGLMLVKGGLVMKGYLGEPELTAKVIRNGYYNTGDIATMSSDGYITITGRLSRFSKIAGEMVPHELVEMSVSEIIGSESHDVAVTGAPDAKRGERLVVFYSNPNLDPEKVIEELQKKNMPPLWIPKVPDFVKLDRIPLLGSGKLDLQTINKLAREHGDQI